MNTVERANELFNNGCYAPVNEINNITREIQVMYNRIASIYALPIPKMSYGPEFLAISKNRCNEIETINRMIDSLKNERAYLISEVECQFGEDWEQDADTDWQLAYHQASCEFAQYEQAEVAAIAGAFQRQAIRKPSYGARARRERSAIKQSYDRASIRHMTLDM